MKRLNVLVLGIAVLLAPNSYGAASPDASAGAEFPLRRWTDMTGRYHAQARFVQLVGTNTRLHRADGPEVDVPLSRLSVRDRLIAEYFGDREGAGADGPLGPSIRSTNNDVTLIVEGGGTNGGEALRDAFEQAVYLAWGVRVRAETEIRDQAVSERSVNFSEGYIADYELLQERRDGLIVYRTIAARIRRQDLCRPASPKLAEAHVTVGHLYPEALTKGNRHEEGCKLIESTLARFPQEIMSVEVAGPAHAVGSRGDNATIAYDLVARVDLVRYNRLKHELVEVLDKLAIHSGTVEACSVSTSKAMPSDVSADLPASSLEDRFASLDCNGEYESTPLQPLRPRVELLQRIQVRGLTQEALYPVSRPRTVVSVNIDRQYGPRGNRWKWFEIDGYLNLSATPVTVAVTWSDEGANPIRRERFTIGPGLPGLSFNPPDPYSRDRRAVILSPFFLQHDGDGFQATNIRFTRRLQLQRESCFTLAELSRVKVLSVAIEATGDAPQGQTLPEQIAMTASAGAD